MIEAPAWHRRQVPDCARGLGPDPARAVAALAASRCYAWDERDNPPAIQVNTADVYFGPGSPGEGLENNWIKTAPGKGRFALFRFYGPLQPYFDKTWILPSVEKA